MGNDCLPHSVGQPWHGHRWMNIMRKERGQYPLVEVAYLPTTLHALRQRSLHQGPPDGRRLQAGRRHGDHRPGKGHGQKELVEACLTGPSTGTTRQVPQKCTFCAHLLDDGWTGDALLPGVPGRAH